MPAMGRRRTAMPGKERMAELPSSLFILSGTNPFRRVAMRFVRWIVFEWIIILTIIGKWDFSNIIPKINCKYMYICAGKGPDTETDCV